MNKKFKVLGLALLALSMTGISAFAQDNNTAGTGEKTNTEQCCRKSSRDSKDARERKDRTARAFEGLTLTEAQQTQLQQLNDQRARQRKQRAEANRLDKQRRDSDMRADRKASQKEYLEQVKAILGPEQYVVFLENIVVNGPDIQGRPMKHHKDGMRKDSKNKMSRLHGQNREKQARPTPAQASK